MQKDIEGKTRSRDGCHCYTTYKSPTKMVKNDSPDKVFEKERS